MLLDHVISAFLFFFSLAKVNHFLMPEMGETQDNRTNTTPYTQTHNGLM